MQSITPFPIWPTTVERRAAARDRDDTAQRSSLVDALRGLAAAAVFVSHAGGALDPRYAQLEANWFDMGKAGLMIFFLASGFLVPASLERYGSLRDFWVGRVLRLYPLYWCVLGSTLLLHLLGLRIPGADQALVDDFVQRPVGTVVANLTMLEALLGYPHLVVVSWSFAIQLLYYALLSVLFVLGYHRQTVPMCVGLLIAAMLGESILAHMLQLQVPRGSISYLASIFVGTTIYRLRRGETSSAAAAGVLLLAGLMLALVAFGNTSAEDGLWMPFSVLTSHVAAYVLFCAAALLPQRAAPAALLGCGRRAYSLLLLHPLVIALLPATTNAWLTLLLWAAVLFFLSTASYRWIEQPSAALAARLRRDRHGKPKSAAVRPTAAVGVMEVEAMPEPLLARALG